MEIEFFGGNCFRIKTKTTSIIVDDNLKSLGASSIQNDKTIAFYTNKAVAGDLKDAKSRLVIDSPGEFEVGDVTVTGVQVRGHLDGEDEQTGTVFQFVGAGQSVTVLGHIHPDISGELEELAGGTDVLAVPVGGNGFTLDPVGAASVIKKLEPSIAIPSQYDIAGLSYEVPAQSLEEFGKISSLTLEEVQDSFKMGKGNEDATGQTKIVVLKPLKK